MRKKAALVLGMAITFSQVAMAEEITSSTEQIENCTFCAGRKFSRNRAAE